MEGEAVRSNGTNSRVPEKRGTVGRNMGPSDLHLSGFPVATEWALWSRCDVISMGAGRSGQLQEKAGEVECHLFGKVWVG